MSYNSQKYSKGRRNNRANAKDSSTPRNLKYQVAEFGNDVILIDSLFSEFDRDIDKSFKGVYISNECENDTLLCLIDESVEIGCEFIGHLEEIYLLALEKVSLFDEKDNEKSLITPLNPSTYHSWRYKIKEIEGHSGFWFISGEFSLYHRWNTHWVISGHSSCLFEEDSEMVYLDKLANMNAIEFYRYFDTLEWD